MIRSALAARGAEVFSAARPIRYLKGVGLSVIPLGLGALRRSQDIALAMELRGFGYAEEAGVHRTLYRDIRMRTSDWWILGLSISGLAAVVVQAEISGTLPRLSGGQILFVLVLLVLLTSVALVIMRVIRTPDRNDNHQA